ncbi:hypothetical protein [Microbulbifer sp. THAF38]|nr:hypothetical protein [Microbulbifer sp. THAF38]QFT54440.1 hypothetical protein FIU95_07725 [Microbulbifer sp. THAF38]
MVILLQGTFTPLVHAHAGRTKRMLFAAIAAGRLTLRFTRRKCER